MLGWYTDNPLSKTVMDSIPDIECRHIREFFPHNTPHVFYGILRGCSRAMHILKEKKIDYHYIDNGYFDALYVNKDMHKSMEGKFRVVKNGMHEVYPYAGIGVQPRKVLIVPPSPYSANFYDTTPEDWVAGIYTMLVGCETKIRNKTCLKPLEEDLAWCDGIVAFNSMMVMNDKIVSDTHGIFRKDFARYNPEDLRAFYEPKQFTLKEFSEGRCSFT